VSPDWLRTGSSAISTDYGGCWVDGRWSRQRRWRRKERN